MVLTVDLLLFTLLSLTCYCYPVKLQVSIMSRVSTLPPVKATVLVLHWIRFVSWLKAQIVIVSYKCIIPYFCLFVKCNLVYF